MGVNWSHKREALSWLVWFFAPLAAFACAVIMPFALAHPILFRVLLFAGPVASVVWVIVVATRKKK